MQIKRALFIRRLCQLVIITDVPRTPSENFQISVKCQTATDAANFIRLFDLTFLMDDVEFDNANW